MQKLRTLLLPSGNGSQQKQKQRHQSSYDISAALRHSTILEPEVGFQITIESVQHTTPQQQPSIHQQQQQQQQQSTTIESAASSQRITIPELNVHLIAARHLPNLFGFKIVQGYQVKVKLFPGSKRLDSSIQTNSWPKFNENFRFPLAPDIRPSLKHSLRRNSKASAVSEPFTPEELFAGQFVVFTVYALLELPPASFSRFNKTYRSLRDKSSNIVQRMVDSSNGIKAKDDKESNATKMENGNNNANGNGNGNGNVQKIKRKSNQSNGRDNVAALTIGESRRNLGSVTCYLEPKLFKRNARTGLYATEELWLPIKDITTTAKKQQNNESNNSPKGVVEIILEVKDTSQLSMNYLSNDDNDEVEKSNGKAFGNKLRQILTTPNTPPTTPVTPPPNISADLNGRSVVLNGNGNGNIGNIGNNNKNNRNNLIKIKNQSWNRMTTEVKRKIGLNNNNNSNNKELNGLILRITTSRMRCTQKVKDELECTAAGNVYVKTAIFEHGIFVSSWKSPTFYPSISIKWNDANDENDAATLEIPLKNVESLANILIRTTLATKTKMGKKLVLGTVLIGATAANENGSMHMRQLCQSAVNERISMWHNYQ